MCGRLKAFQSRSDSGLAAMDGQLSMSVPESPMMNDQEWAHFVEIYRELCKARADIWALSSMLRAVRLALQDDRPDMAMRTVTDWEKRMPRDSPRHSI